MHAKLTEHVGYEKHDPMGNNSGNSRNGTSNEDAAFPSFSMNLFHPQRVRCYSSAEVATTT